MTRSTRPRPRPVRRVKGLTMTLQAAAVAAGLAAGTPPAGAAELVIDGAWVRAMPPGSPMTAAYLRCTNAGSAAVALRGATASAAGQVTLHATRQKDGRATMMPADWPLLQPGEVLQLEPGGLHLMLEGLTRLPESGEAVELCLITGQGSHCVDAPVRRSQVAPGGGHGHHGAAGGRT